MATERGAILTRDSTSQRKIELADADVAESGRRMAMTNTFRDATRLWERRALIIVATAAGLAIPLAALRAPAKDQPVRSGSAPQGWHLAGSNPENYESGVDSEAKRNGFPIAYLKSKPSATEGFGTLMQSFSASKYAGQRIRLSASAKSDEVSDWAGLWMRVDVNTKPFVIDNMQNRAIKGSLDWREYQVVLDVPKDATNVAFGILLSKSGMVWLNNVRFEIVSTEVPVTAKPSFATPRPEDPVNLNFEISGVQWRVTNDL
jgi:hypothetical protein